MTAVLAVAVCAVLGGACSFAAIADWLYDLDESSQARLGFTRGAPAGTTFWRLLTRLDATLVSAVLADWLNARTPPAVTRPRRYRTVIAVDGKTLRGARLPDGRQVHLLSALDTSTGIVLAQVTVDAKSNEIPAFAPLLDAVEKVLGSLTGIVFVADALHTQTDHAQQITARGAHLLLQAKGNQPTLFKQLKALPWAQIPVGDRTRDTGHGRKETRTVKAVTLHTPGGIAFPHAQQAVRITRTRTIDGKTSRETAYLITSVPARTPTPPTCSKGRERNGRSKTRSTSSGTSHTVKTSTRHAPAPDRPSWPPCVTPRSAGTASTAPPTSPAPTAEPTAGHTTSYRP